MKKALLFSLCAGMIALTFSSYTNGPFAGGAGNHTGSAGSPANCSTGSGCHATNNVATICSLTVTPAVGGAQITSYVPGGSYKVQVVGFTTGTAFPKFGFQASCVKAASTSVQAGTFSATGNVAVRGTTLKLVEQATAPIAGTSAGPGTAYLASFDWIAPVQGTGSVQFYLTLNAVNGNTTSAGDQPNTATPLLITEAPASGVGSAISRQLNIYPNPATDVLHLGLARPDAHTLVCVYDAAGRTVIAREAGVVHGELIIPTTNLNAGNYYILAQQGDQRYGAMFVKQ